MFNGESFLRLIYSVLVAALITMFALVFSSGYTETVLYILKGMLAGAVIWFLGEVLFTMCEKFFTSSIVPGYIVLAFLILLGTAGFGFVLGIDDVWLLAAMSLAAEVCGIGVTLFYRHKYSRSLNEKLEQCKKEM